MPVFLDILIIAVLILFVWRGASKGFVYTLCSLLAVAVALAGGRILADTFTPAVSGFLRPTLERTIQSALEEQTRALGGQFDALTVRQALDMLEAQGGIFASAAQRLSGDLPSFSGVLSSAAAFVTEAAAAVAEQIAHSVLFSIGFVLILIVWKIFSHALDLVARLPVIHGCNEILGGLLGLVTGLIFVFLSVWILCNFTGVIPPGVVAETRVLRFLAGHSPVDLLLFL